MRIDRPGSGQVGFSLIELMIVVVILGILAAIVYPSYTRYVVRANKAEAQEFMLDTMSRAEQYRLDARDYPTGFSDLNVTVPDRISGLYDVTVSADNTATPPSFTVTAAPKAGTQQAGEDTLTLNSSGVRTPPEEW